MPWDSGITPREIVDIIPQLPIVKALADYVTLYTQASDTAWGMLAGLHIEPIAD